MRFDVGNGNWADVVTPLAPIHSVYDATTNDSNKSWTVPDGEIWKLTQAFVTMVTTADVGNRQIRFTATDADGNQIGYISAGAVQAASLTRGYGFLQGVYRETAFVDAMIEVPIPQDLYIGPGGSIKFWDSAAVAAAADDMTVAFTVQRYPSA